MVEDRRHILFLAIAHLPIVSSLASAPQINSMVVLSTVRELVIELSPPSPSHQVPSVVALSQAVTTTTMAMVELSTVSMCNPLLLPKARLRVVLQQVTMEHMEVLYTALDPVIVISPS